MLMDLSQLRLQWNSVLDHLERLDRITWISFFDARLADFDGRILTLDFRDSRKLNSAHEFSAVRERQILLLKVAVKEVLGIDIEIIEL